MCNTGKDEDRAQECRCFDACRCSWTKIDIAKSEAIAELHSMVGLDEVKRNVDQLVTTANKNMDLEAAGQAIEDFKLHKVFHGNPGLSRVLFDGYNSCSSY